MNLPMNPLGNPLRDPLTTHPIQTCREIAIESKPNCQFRYINDQDPQFGDVSVSTLTRTRSDSLEPLLTLRIHEPMSHIQIQELHIALTAVISISDLPIVCAGSHITICPGFSGALEHRL